MLGGQITAYDQLGYVQPRLGNRSVNNAPRNVYRSRDGQWLAVSTSSQSIAERVIAPGRAAGPRDAAVVRHRTRASRARRRARCGGRRLDRGARRRRGQRRLSTRRRPQSARSTTYGHHERSAVRGARHDHHGGRRRARAVADAERLFRLSDTPGAVRWAGRPHGADTEAVLSEIGCTPSEIARLREAKVV